MLPNHAPLVVAEQFGMLEALHPGRIDLGIGRAPGTDQLTAAALRRGAGLGGRRVPRSSSASCSRYFDGTRPEGIHRARRGRGRRSPAIWLLGSSDYSAQLAGDARPAVLVRPPLRAAATRCRRSRSTATRSARPRCSSGPT